jgi:cytochrome c551/c552
MPNMQLTHREAVEISAFLLQTAQTQTAWELHTDLAKIGKLLFEKLNCASCHTESFIDTTPIEKLNASKGCLSSEQGAWPNFNFSKSDRSSIQACLQQTDFKLDDQQKVDVSLKAFKCTACHRRNGLGGISSQRNQHFQTTNLNLGDQGRIPPSLTGVGSKLKSDWLRDVMVNGRSIRPYMKTRMPQFGEPNIGHLFELFENNDALGPSKYAEFEDQKMMREKGHVLTGNKGLNCVACHTFQFKTSDTMPAVDLTEMAQRLKKDWFYQYMLAPQKFSPNTVMPSFWPGGKAIRSDIEGTPEHQIEAMWQYLLDGRQARAPAGVVREPLEIIVTNEAKMLRRQYPGIGKRGIGVGYPGGINIAFDAEQMRLASIWRGKFAEASGVWRGQGSGNVRPMNRQVQFEKGPEVDLMSSPWEVDDGRPPAHQFKGYSLDKLQRPTFLYTISGVKITDGFLEFQDDSGATQLRRTITLLSPTKEDDLRFRIKSKSNWVSEEATMSDDGKLVIKLDSNPSKNAADTDTDEKQMVLPIRLEPNQKREISIEYLLK